MPRAGRNKLMAIAAPVLSAATRIEAERGNALDVEHLRRAMIDAMHRFETDGLAAGLDPNVLRAARYALCATIDDIVLATPEGRTSAWAQQGLTSIFEGEVVGGERFYDILDQLHRDIGRQESVVELMYLCISLGFAGRYRVRPRGVGELTELREGIYNTLRQRHGEFERELSPHWHGIDAGARPLARRIPIWVLALGTLTIASALFVVFTFSLSSASEIAFAQLFALPPRGQAVVPRPPRPAAAPPQPVRVAAAPVSAPTSFAQRLRQFLEPEIKAGLVQVLEDAQTITVRLTNRNMFGSGEATLGASWTPLLGRIGEALNEESGAVTINGYTDDQAIHTLRFPSNFELSQARADAVAAQLRARMKEPARLKARGKAQSDPIAANTTAEGRQQNRRTEIVLIRTADGT